ncbi:aldose epimerase family protein [Salipaludibacillus aurantiacus]|uniref:Aldose 1-epimerase n=1 Tax=Salipaludibacillus aurantiacus TaxID=1601833 RepID=A0A1H9RWB3_9BACI|nr:aldose epimerase family protein [Salipaludibacillus aurantiacus]SER76199.1 aldose 1-epimerase [Salipaludibacillus aurantiacus]
MKKKVASFNGQDIFSYTIENSRGVSLTALNYGAAIIELLVPDQYGKKENIVINYSDISDYENNPHYLGVVAGRTAGRTAEGILNFDGRSLQLDKNDGNNHLHGGFKGLSRKIWDVIQDEARLTFECVSADGEDGYPGEVSFKVVYELTDENKLVISYWAEPDEKTPINLTNHTYFNLSGDKKTTVLDHILQLSSSKFYELAPDSIPIGTTDVDRHPAFDFRAGKPIRDAIEQEDKQLEIVKGGLDHPFLLDEQPKVKARLSDPKSGRTLAVETEDPAIVVYSGNQIEQKPELNGSEGKKYDGICLETQMPPNETETYLVDKGDIYEKQTVFSLGTTDTEM